MSDQFTVPGMFAEQAFSTIVRLVTLQIKDNQDQDRIFAESRQELGNILKQIAEFLSQRPEFQEDLVLDVAIVDVLVKCVDLELQELRAVNAAKHEQTKSSLFNNRLEFKEFYNDANIG
ncbi:MAG: hypothetical protein EZS28_015209 [Streblomastix strix]|uniref:Uncharacterized protein n=1 Tax=Streblomastix strix TaxID=222440 RepID=A0A5J4W2P8_9EUKA|nr:MAG: hypothetical protein EZS28_015209 [Streblomastix strix]